MMQPLPFMSQALVMHYDNQLVDYTWIFGNLCFTTHLVWIQSSPKNKLTKKWQFNTWQVNIENVMMTFMMNVMKEGERERNRNVIVAEKLQ